MPRILHGHPPGEPLGRRQRNAPDHFFASLGEYLDDDIPLSPGSQHGKDGGQTILEKDVHYTSPYGYYSACMG